MKLLNSYGLTSLISLLAGLLSIASARAQYAGFDPAEPIVIMLKTSDVTELIPLKDFCAKKYP